jgi:hypothetical protein
MTSIGKRHAQGRCILKDRIHRQVAKSAKFCIFILPNFENLKSFHV